MSIPQRRVPSVSGAVVRATSIYAILGGALTLAGWAFDIRRLTDWGNDGISMFPNTAVCALLCGVSLLLTAARESGWRLGMMRAAAGIVIVIAGATLLEHLFGWNLGIDTLILERPWGQRAAAAPMRMGPPASIAFLALSLCVLLASAGVRERRIASTLALLPVGISTLSLTGYWFGADQLFGVARYTGIAWQTSTMIAALGIGTLAAVPEAGVVAALGRQDAGGALLRRLIVPIVLIPLVLGWLRMLGQNAGLYDTAFGTSLRSLIEVVLFFVLLWWTSNSVSRYESSASEARSRLAAIVESTDDAVVSKSLDGVIKSWNVGAERIFGYSAAEAVGKHITMIIPSERIDEETEIVSRIKRGERVEHFETIRVRKDGIRIHVSLTISPVKDADGRITGASKIARDITEQRLVQEQLRAIVDATPECVQIVDPDGALQFINRAGLAMFEADSEKAVLGKSALDLVVHEHRADWQSNHERVCGGEKLSWEFSIVGLKGTRRWMESHAAPLPLPDGRTGQLAVTREVTLQKQLEQEREKLLESERWARNEAERASQLKDEFLATVSHELRTPLNSILGWSQLLNVSPNTADLKQGLEVIERNARAQAQLIEDLLDMSRIISGKVRLDVQTMDLPAVIQAAIESIAPAAEAKGIRLRKVLDPQAGTVSGDPTRLQQVVWNLLTNAIKFTPKGGAVDIILQRVNSHLEIIVHDTGIGIAEESLAAIFERFRQVDSSTTRSQGGLGIGLSIVKQLVELHGGSITAKSAGEGHGATFIVTLPLSPVLPAESRVHPTASKARSLEFGQVDLRGVKVLVVDDEPDARTLIRRVLTECGAEVIAAESASHGLEQLLSNRPHVVVSDIGMPVKDGYQFIREVRNLDEAKGGRTPAIALTAFARSEDRMRAMLAGYQVHVAKPIEPQELAVTVHTLSRRSGASAH
jgi:PAS domain S-box-containing protein